MAIIMDTYKAFDVVGHDILFGKCEKDCAKIKH